MGLPMEIPGVDPRSAAEACEVGYFRVSGSVALMPVGTQERGMLLVARDGIEPPTPAFSGPPTELAK
jgi:hypothetical protein